jgi:hypothetical protein
VGAGHHPEKWVQVFNLHKSGCRFLTCTCSNAAVVPQVENLRPLVENLQPRNASAGLPKTWVQVFNLHMQQRRGCSAG